MNIRQLKIVLKKRGYNDVHFYYTLCLPSFRIQPVLTVGADPYCCLIKESENKWITTMQERGNLLEIGVFLQNMKRVHILRILLQVKNIKEDILIRFCRNHKY